MIKSLCTRKCKLDKDKVCEGCGRTIKQIAERHGVMYDVAINNRHDEDAQMGKHICEDCDLTMYPVSADCNGHWWISYECPCCKVRESHPAKWEEVDVIFG